MKICRIVYEMPPPWDGLAPHPYEVTLAQSKQGHDITVFCGQWPNAGKTELIPGVTYHHIMREPFPATISLTSSVILFCKYLLWRRTHSPDILHCHGHFAIWIYCYRNFLNRFLPWSQELTIPLVAHFHNTGKGRWEQFNKEGKYISPHSKYIQWPLTVFSDQQAVKAATACIFVSLSNRDEAVKYYGADPRRLFVVETGVNTELFVPVNQLEKEKSRRDMNLDSLDKVILNLGSMVERKNILLLVQAMKFLPLSYKLMLVGTWDAAYQTKVLKEIAKAGLEDRVIRIGYTPYPLTPIAYQISDIFVLPSSWEGLPKAVMQSLACNIPVLVSGFKLQQDLPGVFYLDKLEPEQIAKEIAHIVENGQKVDVAALRVKYSWNERIKEIDKVYDFAKATNV
jgi:glycosyltransferase involved in cell wall biosynthesis